MKQEEDSKIATMGPMEYLRSNELEQVIEEEEDYGDDELMEERGDGDDQGQGGKEQGSQVGAETVSGESGLLSERASSGQHVRSISASSVSSVSSSGSVRTAKAEKRLKERLSHEVSF